MPPLTLSRFSVRAQIPLMEVQLPFCSQHNGSSSCLRATASITGTLTTSTNALVHGGLHCGASGEGLCRRADVRVYCNPRRHAGAGLDGAKALRSEALDGASYCGLLHQLPRLRLRGDDVAYLEHDSEGEHSVFLVSSFGEGQGGSRALSLWNFHAS